MSEVLQADGPAAGEAILSAREVVREFRMGRSTIRVLRGVSLEVRRGEMISVMGASGAGKTTLLNILGGLDRPTGGRVFFGGEDLYRLSSRRRTVLRARRVGFVFQAYHLLPELDVLENVLLPAMALGGRAGTYSTLRRRAEELLLSVGLGDRARHRPAELSGGEQQRAALARALMNDPEIIFADEPTGNLDSETGEQVLGNLFRLVKERGHTLVLVTHNREIAVRCGRTLHLRDGRIVDEEVHGGGEV